MFNAHGRQLLWRLLRPETFRAFAQSDQDGRASREELDARWHRAISTVIAEAARHVPFYREHWGGRGILAAAERGNVDLSDLPLLRRTDVQTGFASLRREGNPDGATIERSTGGSTGEPMRFIQSRRYLRASEGRGLRLLAWGGWRVGEKTALIWGGPNELRLSSGLRERLKREVTNRRVYDAFRTGPSVYEQWIAEWRRWQPRFLIGYASALAGVADYMLTTGVTLEGISVVFSTAEKLYPVQREKIRCAFGSPVRDQYGSREVPSVASECTFGRMHAYQDSAFVELLPCELAELSSVVLTQLDNPTMPLIRYANGDLARWSSETSPCPCGLRYPVIQEIAGRTSDLFHFAGGRVVHGEYFTHVMYDMDGVDAFQFYQARDQSVTLFVQPRRGVDPAALERRLNAKVRRLPEMLDATFDLRVRFVPEIPRRGQGKHRFTLSEYQQ